MLNRISKLTLLSWAQMTMVPLPMRAGEFHASSQAASADPVPSVRESTASLTSSIFEYRNFHGRTYQSSSTTEYWAPNDDKHIEAFDVGDMADEFPSAEVIGTDISPTQPSWVPPNLGFQIDDAQLDWTFEPNSFDFIHVRFMYGAIDDWPKLYRQMYTFLKPGGWFQHIEPDILSRCGNPDSVEGTNTFKQWAQLFYDAGDKFGRTFRLTDMKMEENARNTGFVDVSHQIFNIPYGYWPKDKRLKQLGQYVGLYLDLSLDGFALYPIGEVLGWSFEEVNVLVAKMRAAIRNQNNWASSDIHMVYGRKPEKPVDTPSPSSPEAAAA
ncbi:hypothetical protein ACJ41O_008435 [Fusarium nematophilum]